MGALFAVKSKELKEEMILKKIAEQRKNEETTGGQALMTKLKLGMSRA